MAERTSHGSDDDRPLPAVPPGHPVDTFLREIGAIADVARRMRALVDDVRAGLHERDIEATLELWRRLFNDLVEIEKHFRRKEELLFSRLERHDVTQFTRVTWARHDEIRQFLKRLDRELARADNTAETLLHLANSTGGPVLDDVAAILAEEENVLLPTALRTLTENEWAEIWRYSPEYGWCLVVPREGYLPPAAAEPAEEDAIAPDCPLPLSTGRLTLAQLEALFRELPVELTFVDEDDRVRYFSPNRERIFDRNVATLGRKVEHCHPPKSVHFVRQILADFHSGAQSKAEFWIELDGRFLHVQFLALRDASGKYLGTLEVTQDATRLRRLQGERRLLDYGSGELGDRPGKGTPSR
jgi:hypothetical protein